MSQEENISKWLISRLSYHQVTGARLHWKLSENPCSKFLRIRLLYPPLVKVSPQSVNSPVLLGCSEQRIKELLWLQKNPRGRIAESSKGTQYRTLAMSVRTVQLQLKSEVG